MRSKVFLIRERHLRMTLCTSEAETVAKSMMIKNRDRAFCPCIGDSLNGRLLTTGFGSTVKTSSNSSVEIHTPNWEAAKNTGLWFIGCFGSFSSRSASQSTSINMVAFCTGFLSWLHGVSGWHTSPSCLVCFRRLNHSTTAPSFWRATKIIRFRLGNGLPSCLKSLLLQSLTSRWATGFYYTLTRRSNGMTETGDSSAASSWITQYLSWPS